MISETQIEPPVESRAGRSVNDSFVLAAGLWNCTQLVQ